ncbi:MAG: hypothetical protein ABR562_08515 [Thermoplasmatota archaeon]
MRRTRRVVIGLLVILAMAPTLPAAAPRHAAHGFAVGYAGGAATVHETTQDALAAATCTRFSPLESACSLNVAHKGGAWKVGWFIPEPDWVDGVPAGGFVGSTEVYVTDGFPGEWVQGFCDWASIQANGAATPTVVCRWAGPGIPGNFAVDLTASFHAGAVGVLGHGPVDPNVVEAGVGKWTGYLY